MGGFWKGRTKLVRVYEAVVIIALLVGGVACFRGAAPEPAPVVRNIPNAVYATPASYRRHRRYRYGIGGK